MIIFSSGSMAPAIPAGSAAITTPTPADSIAGGDVITVRRDDGRLVTHRVQEVTSQRSVTFVTLRGDANAVDDPHPYALQGPVQRVVWSVPGIGRLMAVMQSPWLLAPFVALLILVLIPTRRPVPPPISGAGGPDASAASDSSDVP
ncbi:hypothetical protein ASF87_10265 [Microbacterium sp. Leaf161]|nr:hypothetical protein ASF87_10265 [Microbacterium sp. Leaf161]